MTGRDCVRWPGGCILGTRTAAVKEEPILLENETEANLLAALLQEERIPFFVKQYTDPAFQGLRTYKDSWGHVDTPSQYRGRVAAILEELRANRSSPA